MQNTTLKKALGLSCLTLTLALSAAFSSNTHAAASDYTPYDLVWSDEFSGESLNLDNWTCEIGNGDWGWGNDEKEYYTNRDTNVDIADISGDTTSGSEDGRALAIIAQREYYNGYAYTSARLKTAQKQTFKYGRIEAKIKMTNGMQNGIWPAFWMLGTEGGWPGCGEIDIMEHANADRYIHGTFHWRNETYNDPNNTLQHAYQGNVKSFPSGTDMDSWHTYAVEWDENSITWYLDDVAFRTQKYDSTTEEMRYEYYILLNVAVGGNFIGKLEPSASWSHSIMYVDYVRVYQKAETGAVYNGTWTKEPLWQNKCIVTLYDEDKTIICATINKGQYLVNYPYTKEGLELAGWYTADGKAFDFSQPVYSDELKLYAKFKAPGTEDPTTVAPTTVAPTTVTPTTVAPTTVAPTTAAPTTIAPTTVAKTTKPKKATIKSIKSKAKRKATIKVNVKGDFDGFQIKYGTNKKVSKNVKKNIIKKKTYTFKKLKSKKTYYFKVRAYKLNANDKKVYGTWSKVKKVKIK